MLIIRIQKLDSSKQVRRTLQYTTLMETHIGSELVTQTEHEELELVVAEVLAELFGTVGQVALQRALSSARAASRTGTPRGKVLICAIHCARKQAQLIELEI